MPQLVSNTRSSTSSRSELLPSLDIACEQISDNNDGYNQDLKHDIPEDPTNNPTNSTSALLLPLDVAL